MPKFIHDETVYTLEEFLDRVEEAFLNEKISFEEKRSILLKVRHLKTTKDEVRVGWLGELSSRCIEFLTFEG